MNHPRLRDVRKIAVLGPDGVGEFMFCLPALHALKHSYPEAQLVCLGLPWHAAFLSGRPGPVDRSVVAPTIRQPGAALETFVDAMRAERFDLALQMAGGGRYANALLARFDARLAVGMRSADAAPLDRAIAYGAPGQRLVIVQPGAGDARRCWPAARFAAVADALVEEGALLAINGTAGEAQLVGAVIAAMRHPAIDLSGKATLGALCGLLERSALVVSNDSGPLHMALALGRACVGIYWFTRLIESAPLCQQRHRAALSTRIDCPVCGQQSTAGRCAHDVSFVDDVALEEVTALAIDLFRSSC